MLLATLVGETGTPVYTDPENPSVPTTLTLVRQIVACGGGATIKLNVSVMLESINVTEQSSTTTVLSLVGDNR